MTADAKTLREIAERVEKLTGPDRAMDEAIYRALGYWWDHDEAEWCQPDSPCPSAYADPPPHYTDSLDAIMTMLPAGHDWALSYDNGSAMAGCSPADVEGCLYSDVAAATPELALCSATLRALAASQEQRRG